MGTAVWMGSIYLILGTNLGARLGFLVAFTGLMGWMALMGTVWWMYGIGLKGEVPEWKQIPGRTVIQEVDLLYQAGVLDEPIPVDSGTEAVIASCGRAGRNSRPRAGIRSPNRHPSSVRPRRPPVSSSKRKVRSCPASSR